MPARSKYFDPTSLVVPASKGGSGDIWSRLLPYALMVLCVLMLGLAAVLFYPAIKRSQDLQAEKVEMEEEIDAYHSQNTRLQEELYALQYDAYYVERMARDVLNYGRRGEIIFRFPPYSKEKSSQ